MSLVIASKIACQRMFQLSDPGVPRTFVEDCRYEDITDHCSCTQNLSSCEIEA